MTVKLIIMGRPGSGKSFGTRCMRDYLQQKNCGWSIKRFNDYEILKEMFHFEKLFAGSNTPKKFQPVEHGGFDVCDFSVLDTSLRELEKRVQQIFSPYKEELICIEFARSDYNKALHLFNSKFLNNTYFLFLLADVNTCLARIKERVAHPASEDDYFVSEQILDCYYNKQIIPDLREWGIPANKVIIINNKGLEKKFRKKMECLTDKIIENEMRIRDIRVPEHNLIDKFSSRIKFLRERIRLPNPGNIHILKS